MAEPAQRPWTTEEFFRWQDGQRDAYELVGGRPKAIAGAANVHDDIVVNIVADLKAQTRGSGCRPFTGDGSVETYRGQIRRPDVGLDCGDRDPRSTLAAQPRLIVEVLSPSTRDFDTFDKLDEYKTVASVEAIVFVEPNQPLAVLWFRGVDRSGVMRHVAGLEAEIDLPALGVSLRMTTIYDGVVFPAQPRLVAGGDAFPVPTSG